jgi:hypothetical protein
VSVQTTSRNAHAAAILTVLNARLGAMATPRAAFEYDDAPTTGGDYVLVSLSRMFGGSDRLGGLANTMWRVTVRAVGSVTNVGVLLDVCTRALEESSITVGGVESTGFRFETETDVEQDDDDTALYSGLRSFTYAF